MPEPTDRSTARLLRRRTTSLALVVALVLGAAAGCSDDDEGSGPTSTTASTSDGTGSTGDEPTGDGEPSDDGESSTSSAPEEVDVELPELTDVEQTYADAVMESVGADATPILPGADNDCLAVVWVDAIGGDALEGSGLTPEEFAAQGPVGVGLDRSTAEEMVDAMDQCGAGPEKFYEEWAAAIGLQPGTDAEAMKCMEEAVSVDDFRDALVATFMGEESDGLNDVQARFEECAPTSG